VSLMTVMSAVRPFRRLNPDSSTCSKRARPATVASDEAPARHLGVSGVWVGRVLKSPIFFLSLADPFRRIRLERVGFQRASP
jgi:hypothetical protein